MRAVKLTESVHRRTQDAALSGPDRLAVTDASESLTYGSLEARANALAHRLRALGVRPGVRVGLCHERSAATVVGALATLKAGGAYVGLDPAIPDGPAGVHAPRRRRAGAAHPGVDDGADRATV